MQNQNVNRVVVRGKEAKEKLLKGVNEVCDVVGSTMGYRGSNNLFETFDGLPFLTKDGKDSLDLMFLSESIENIACELVKEACRKQHREVGDGTTAVCILTQAFFQNSLKAVESGKNEIEISQDILKSVEKVNAYLDSIAVPLTEKLMYDIAKTAGNGDEELAQKVTDAFIKSGEHGTVSHRRSMTDETFVSFIDGNPIESGFADERFINVQETQSVVFDNPLVVVSNIHFQTINEIIPFLNIAFPQNIEGVEFVAPRPIVFIGTMEDNITESLVANVKSGYPIAVIKTPYFGKKGRENMADIAMILGCEVLDGISRSDYRGKENIYVGTCQRIEIGEKDAVVTIDPKVSQEKSKGKIDELLEQIKNHTNIHEVNYLKERIAKITGGISTIMIGGYTESEVEERIARYDDAISAVRSAKEGVVAGGGVALFNASYKLELDDVSKYSLLSPFKKILSNAGKDLAPNTANGHIIGEYPMGYDVKEYKELNMFDAGILDTVKGIKTALVNSASASNNLLRCNFVMPFKRNPLNQ